MMKGMTLKDGLDLVRKTRPAAEPNAGFLLQLKAFEKAVHGSVSSGLPIFKKKTAQESEDQTPPEKTVPEQKESSQEKEIENSIEQMKIAGDQEGAKEIEEKLH